MGGPLVSFSVGTGLLCRVEGGCKDDFRAYPNDPKSAEALQIAARMRNCHELEAHGYVHVIAQTDGATFGGTGRAPARKNALVGQGRDLGLAPAGSF